MALRWLIEKDTYQDGVPERMVAAVRERGMRATVMPYVPFSESGVENFDQFPLDPGDRVVVYGSINLVRALQRSVSWQPLAWADFEKLRCSYYYAHWGQFLLQEDYAFLPLAEVKRRRKWIFRTFADATGRVFLRPDDNTKSFHGEVVHVDEFDRWYRIANIYEPGPACLTVISRPVAITNEWRLVIADRQVITGSGYRAEGRLNEEATVPDEVRCFANEVAAFTSFQPSEIYTMDIATTPAGFRLIEVGSVNCSGLYGCDIPRVVQAITEIAMRADAEA